MAETPRMAHLMTLFFWAQAWEQFRDLGSPVERPPQVKLVSQMGAALALTCFGGYVLLLLP